MLKVVYFASIRERLGCDEEVVTDSSTLQRVEDLVAVLSARGELWRAVLTDSKVLVAVNQEMSRMDAVVSDGDEVAFFPPVTGG